MLGFSWLTTSILRTVFSILVGRSSYQEHHRSTQEVGEITEPKKGGGDYYICMIYTEPINLLPRQYMTVSRSLSRWIKPLSRNSFSLPSPVVLMPTIWLHGPLKHRHRTRGNYGVDLSSIISFYYRSSSRGRPSPHVPVTWHCQVPRRSLVRLLVCRRHVSATGLPGLPGTMFKSADVTSSSRPIDTSQYIKSIIY